MSLSRLSAECRQCPFVGKCDNKRMEALACLPEPIAASTSQSYAEGMVEPILRETMTTIIDGKPTIIYRDEIEKQLYEHLYSGLCLQYGC